jgi:hypothetical protein
MDQPPELSTEDKAYVEEKTRRMVAVAALRRIQMLVRDYRDARAPIELGRSMEPGARLSPDQQARVPLHARRVAGFAAMLKVQQLVREYRESRKAANRAAARIAIFFAGVLAAIAAVYLVSPTVLHSLFRMFSY